MRITIAAAAFACVVGLVTGASAQQADRTAPFRTGELRPVTPDNFARAETDLYFANVAANGGFGRFDHTREPAPLDKQTVIRLNRDTLYSAAVFDLDAGPVTIRLPEAGKRFVSMQVIDQDQYTYGVHYDPGTYTLTREKVGTRYVVVAVRILVDPANVEDMREAHRLQDAIGTTQDRAGEFKVPNWDPASQNKVRGALLVLASTLPDTNRMYGRKDEVDPVRFLIGAAQGWGANPPKEALYLNIVPEKNDGKTVHLLTVKDVPVDGFWSVTVYNEKGYFEPNPLGAYSLNDVTGRKEADGSLKIQFGGCDGRIANCLPIMAGWNYMVRLYRPRAEILDGTWRFPDAKAVSPVQ
ncbi:DUF1254 domain-containing protein [Enterovirga rhinocerotis]|uniref:Uncharacterized protein DUF1214 n=1 Tax=Enterovirga rhinocerotis TaxID=1339210 RepID=A0A4R7BJB6_9HYPH|nr:DUF1254 domain-containing protein [Enterovirga rhinocerotis]TDR85348.1 uncharacterized protein DUF1214 [Enterovirga rhinocerotis]